MAAAKGRTTGIQITWYFSTTLIPTDGAWASWFGPSQLVGNNTSNEIVNATGTPEVGAEASSATEAVFGQARKYEYATPGDPATFELMAEYDRNNTIHQTISDADGGTNCAVAAHIKTGTDEETIVGITGELKETKLQFDAEGLTKLVIPVAVDQIYEVDQT